MEQRFPGIDAKSLYQAWASVSEIIPLINSACYLPNDAHIAPEGCIAREGFLSVDDYYFSFWPMAGSGIHSVEEWGGAIVVGKELEGITPLQVSDTLDRFATTAQAVLPKLRYKSGSNEELKETLNDIESMAYLGRYYADKMRGAAKLAAFREDIHQKHYNTEAVNHFKDALEEWKAYTSLMSSRYKSQLMARTHFMDWERILPYVEKEVTSAKQEGDYPEISFNNLKDGARLPAEMALQVELTATDRDGIRDVKLYLNGLLLKASTEKLVWNGKSDELLEALNPGHYRLKAVAEDKTGIFGWREIQIIVGTPPENRHGQQTDEIHQVILEEGERLMDDKIREFPRLECYLTLRDDGRLVLYNGMPGYSKGLLWKAMMHSDHGTPHYATLQKGQLITFRGRPGQEEATAYKTRPVSQSGSYKLGITTSKRLVIFREVEGQETDIVWKSELLEKWRL